MTDRPALVLADVTKRFGSLLAVDAVSFEVPPGERHALIGPNGAGKSTLFNVVTGTLPVTDGRIVLHGEDITRAPEHRRAVLGVARTFQHSSLFDRLSGFDNVAMAVQRRAGVARRLLRHVDRFTDVAHRANDLLAQVGLAERRDARAGDLSHGERRQLEVAIALATEPTLLLLDEPTAGMSSAEARAFIAMISELPRDLTVVIVEHDMEVVFALADRISVLDAGRLLASGTPEDIRSSPAVQEAYLGSYAAESVFGDGT